MESKKVDAGVLVSTLRIAANAIEIGKEDAIELPEVVKDWLIARIAQVYPTLPEMARLLKNELEVQI